MRIRLTLAALMLGVAASPANAETTTQVVRLSTREPAPLLVGSGARADCSEGEAPESRVVVEPKHGSLVVREGRLRQDESCPPSIGYVVVYIPEPDYTGRDEVALEVVDADGVNLQVFDIQVGPDRLPEGAVAS